MRAISQDIYFHKDPQASRRNFEEQSKYKFVTEVKELNHRKIVRGKGEGPGGRCGGCTARTISCAHAGSDVLGSSSHLSTMEARKHPEGETLPPEETAAVVVAVGRRAKKKKEQRTLGRRSERRRGAGRRRRRRRKGQEEKEGEASNQYRRENEIGMVNSPQSQPGHVDLPIPRRV